MNNLISVATGTFFQSFANVELQYRCIEAFQKLDIDGIELTLGRTTLVPRINEEHRAYLKSLKHVSIHTPFGTAYTDTGDVKELITLLKELYDSICAKNIVIHPNQIEDYKLFAGMQYSTENLPPRKYVPHEKFDTLFNQFPELKLTLDVGHALWKSPEELEQLITKYKDKVVQVHFHDFRSREDHQPFHTTDNPAKYSAVKQFNVPIVIEEKHPTLNIDFLRREIDFVRDYFSRI